MMRGSKMRRASRPCKLAGAWLISLLLATCAHLLATAQDHTTLIEGWTRVNQYWPMEQGEFMVAHAKGHYSVEARLPDNPAGDFIVKLEYFYQYNGMRPSILVVPCDGEAFPIARPNERNQWVTHELEIKKEQCTGRPTVAYSVLLHDSRSVFAWKYMKVSQKGVLEESESFNENHPDEPERNRTGEQLESTTLAPTTEQSSTARPPTQEESSTALPAETQTVPAATEFATTAAATTNQYWNPTSQTPFNGDESQDDASMRVRAQQVSTKRTLVCRARSCDRSVFDYSQFRPLINGIPEGVTQEELAADMEMHLSTGDHKSLNLTIRSDNIAALSEVDLCIEFQLYMEPNTVLDFELSAGVGFRLLESIRRESADSTANKWDRFKRCLSEYIPKLPASLTGSDHVLLRLVPSNLNNSKRLVAVLLDKGRVSFIRKAYPVMEYLPDLAAYTDANSLEKFWVLDKDGLVKPEVQLIRQQPNATKLLINHIDSHQLSFDLTSRWLKVSSVDLQDNRFLFTYRLQRADWIKSLDFEFQSAASEGNQWHTQNLYRASDQVGAASSSSSWSSSSLNGTRALVAANSDTSDAAATHLDNPLPISAIKLKGLTTDEFRLRLRHYIKPAIPDSPTHGAQKELVVDTLAFGDICALGSYCKNGATCKPTGLATGQCTCPQGFSGDHCEQVHPCEALYGDRKGSELCASIGATCEPRLPVFRCVWPSDEYLSCRVLYRGGEASGDQPATTGHNDTAGAADLLPATDGELRWREKAESMSRLVVILSVFMVALLLFAFVIMGNLIGRLMKTKSNLRNSQLEMHQLSKRSPHGPTASTSAHAPARFAPTSGGGGGGALRRPSGGGGAGPPAPPVVGAQAASYSNRSFDAS